MCQTGRVQLLIRLVQIRPGFQASDRPLIASLFLFAQLALAVFRQLCQLMLAAQPRVCNANFVLPLPFIVSESVYDRSNTVLTEHVHTQMTIGRGFAGEVLQNGSVPRLSHQCRWQLTSLALVRHRGCSAGGGLGLLLLLGTVCSTIHTHIFRTSVTELQ